MACSVIVEMRLLLNDLLLVAGACRALERRHGFGKRVGLFRQTQFGAAPAGISFQKRTQRVKLAGLIDRDGADAWAPVVALPPCDKAIISSPAKAIAVEYRRSGAARKRPRVPR